MSLPTQGSTQRRLLLVEGNDDLRFFIALFDHLETTDIAVGSYNGKDNLRNDLSERVRSPEFRLATSLGIVRDADNSSQSAFDSVIGSLRRVGLPTPDAPVVPKESDGLRVSVLIIPPNETRGELENVCLSSIEGTLDWQCVESYLDCLSMSEPPVQENNKAKVRLHSYLAAGPIHTTDNGNISGRRPALRLGEAAEAGVWDWSSPAFERLEEFLRNL